MPWYLTTPRQVKGFKRELNRVDEALSRQDVRGLGSPLARLRGALGFGAVAGVGILVVAFVVALISPKPDSSRAVSTPRPNPHTSRPPLRWSSVMISRASFCGRRREMGVTIGPKRTRSVANATAARATVVSATSSAPGSARRR